MNIKMFEWYKPHSLDDSPEPKAVTSQKLYRTPIKKLGNDIADVHK